MTSAASVLGLLVSASALALVARELWWLCCKAARHAQRTTCLLEQLLKWPPAFLGGQVDADARHTLTSLALRPIDGGGLESNTLQLHGQPR